MLASGTTEENSLARSIYAAGLLEIMARTLANVAKQPRPHLEDLDLPLNAAHVLVWTALRPREIRGIIAMEIRARGALTMKPIARIGMDTSKNVFQLHGVDNVEEPVLRRQFRRREIIKFFENMRPTLIAIEACGSSHY